MSLHFIRLGNYKLILFHFCSKELLSTKNISYPTPYICKTSVSFTILTVKNDIKYKGIFCPRRTLTAK